MNQPSSPKLFRSKWRIWIPVIIGVGISAFILFSSLSNSEYVPVEAGTGNYNYVTEGVDKNSFVPAQNGDYKKFNLSLFANYLGSLPGLFSAIFLAILFMVGRDFFYIVRIRVLTKGVLSWKQATRSILLWEYASALSPGTVGGTAIAMFILEREGIKLGKSTTLVIITALLDNLFFVLFVPILVLLVGHQFRLSDYGGNWIVHLFWGGYFVLFAACLFLFLSLFKFPQLPRRFFELLFKLKPLRKWQKKAEQVGLDIEMASKDVANEPRSFWIKAFGASCGSWFSRFLVINALLTAFSTIGFVDHLKVLCSQFNLWLVMLISPTPGASGVAEVGFLYLFEFQVGLTTLSTLVIILLWRFVSYYPYLIIGSIILPRWLRKTTKS